MLQQFHTGDDIELYIVVFCVVFDSRMNIIYGKITFSQM